MFAGNNPVNESDPSGFAPEEAKPGSNPGVSEDLQEDEAILEKAGEIREEQAAESRRGSGVGSPLALREELDEASARKNGTLKNLLRDNQKLLDELEEMHRNSPEWQGIDPEKTPVFYRNKDEVDKIRAKSGEQVRFQSGRSEIRNIL